MKKIIFIALILCFTTIQAQNVGINTDDPKTTLDITKGNSDYPGLTAPRVTEDDLIAKDYGSDQTGAVVYVTAVNNNARHGRGQTDLVTTKGYYYFDGAKWNRLDNKLPENTYYVSYILKYKVADRPVDISANNSDSGTTQDLGLEIPITIPAHSKVLVRVEYSVPMGFVGNVNLPNAHGYYGIKFLRKDFSYDRDFSEQPMASRKFLAITNNQSSGYESVTSVSAKFVEEYDNTSKNSPVNITYKLQGYAERTSNTTRYNMYDTNGGNRWGKGTITLHSYIQVKNLP